MGSTLCIENRHNNTETEIFGIKSKFNNNKHIVIKFESSDLYQKKLKKKRKRRKRTKINLYY